METPVAVQWALLALVAGGGLYGVVATKFVLLATYLVLWSVFHLGEYLVTWMWLARTLTPYSFLIYGANGSLHVAAVHLVSIAEHVVTKRNGWGAEFPGLGAAVALLGIVIRLAAIATCGDSFSHYIETQALAELVTHGIYGWCRHPSYLGYILYVVGMQLILGNVVTFVASLAVLSRFFYQRMKVEEYFLVNRLYGQAYVDYQKRVLRLVPYIY